MLTFESEPEGGSRLRTCEVPHSPLEGPRVSGVSERDESRGVDRHGSEVTDV